MNIRVLVHELEVCAVYNAIHPDIQPPLQPSEVKTVLGFRPGAVPVLGEAHIPVQIDSCRVVVNFLVADIAGDEALLGNPFLTQAQACLDFGNHRIEMFGEEVPYYNLQSNITSLTVPQHLQELYAQSSTELNAEELVQLARLLSTYGSVFSTGPTDLGRTSLVQHDIINLPGIPVKQPPRQMAGEKQTDG